jgi:hypothetical protein
MYPDSQVERILPARLRNVLVGANAGRFQRFARKLFVLVGDKMAAEGEVIDGRAFTTEIKNSDLSG